MAAQQSTTPFGDYLEGLNNDQQGLTVAINALIEQDKTGLDLKTGLTEIYGPSDLFKPAILELPLLLKDLRDTLRERNVTIISHSSNRVFEKSVTYTIRRRRSARGS